MFTRALCAIFLVNLRWPKSKSLYDVAIWVRHRRTLFIFVIFRGFPRGFFPFLGALVGRLAGISPRFHVVKITGIRHFHMSYNPFLVGGQACLHLSTACPALCWNCVSTNGQKQLLLRPKLFKQEKQATKHPILSDSQR